MAVLWKLVKIFDEYDDILISGKAYKSKYNAIFKLQRKNDATLDFEKIQSYVENLKQKYPEAGFTLKQLNINGKLFYVITKKSIINGKRVKDRVPIYIDLNNQEFYVPKSYIVRSKKLTNYILMRVLGTLGVATVKYLKLVGHS